MNIRERAIHLVLIWMKVGRRGREGGGVGERADSLKVEESVQARDRGSNSPLGRSEKKNAKDR